MRRIIVFLVAMMIMATTASAYWVILIPQPQYPLIGSMFYVESMPDNNNWQSVIRVSWLRSIHYPPFNTGTSYLPGSITGANDTAGVPGYYDYSATYWYAAPAPVQTNTITTEAGVAPPDSNKIISGILLPTMPDMPCTVKLQVYSGANKVGTMMSGSIGDQIDGVLVYKPDGTSVPGDAGSLGLPSIMMIQGVISDRQTYGGELQQYPINGKLLSYSMAYEVIFWYFDERTGPESVTIQVGSQPYTWVKWDADDWMIRNQ